MIKMNKIEVIREIGEPIIKINGKKCKNGEYAENEHYTEDSIFVESTLDELKSIYDIKSSEFPDKLNFNINSSDGFETDVFHELIVFKENGNISLQFICAFSNEYWEGKWGLTTFLNAINEQIEYMDDFKALWIDIKTELKELSLLYCNPSLSLGESITNAISLINKIVKHAEVFLSGMSWKKEFETDETLFCTEIISPLLKRMGFISVRYQHGTKEYGKDFTFSELTPFGQMRHYGLQAKAGDISGEVNSEIDELLGQIEDAFSMPYYELGSKEPRYISTFIIAISGKFTQNAKEKLIEKIPKGVIGSLYFMDREIILDLIEKYWVNKL